MFVISDTIQIPESEVSIRFVLASGPGGQNVNKVATAAQLQFDVGATTSIPADVKDRLGRLAGSRLSKSKVLTINARRFRTQERNREDAIERFVALVQKAAIKPKPRKKTKISRAAKLARLEDKRKASERKRGRMKVFPQD